MSLSGKQSWKWRELTDGWLLGREGGEARKGPCDPQAMGIFRGHLILIFGFPVTENPPASSSFLSAVNYFHFLNCILLFLDKFCCSFNFAPVGPVLHLTANLHESLLICFLHVGAVGGDQSYRRPR